jgi:hypothetical protein
MPTSCLPGVQALAATGAGLAQRTRHLALGPGSTGGTGDAASAGMRAKCWCIVGWLAVGLAACTPASGRGPLPQVRPEDSIQSGSMEEMPPTGTSGLGTPGGYEDASLPLVRPDGGTTAP